MTADKRFAFPPGVAFQRLGSDEEGVMMSLATGYLYRCNASASVVLAALAAGKSLDEACDELGRRFGIDAPRASRDAQALVADLCQRKLICEAA